MPVPARITETIKKARLDAGLTQQKLGELCGYTESSAMRTVQRWESGARFIPHEKLRIVARLLNLTLEDLIP